jgi:hypothetical protein
MFLCAICDRPRHHRDHGYYMTSLGEACEDCWQDMGKEYIEEVLAETSASVAADIAAYEARQYEMTHPQQDVGMGSYPCEVDALLAPTCVSCGRLLTEETGSTMNRCDCCYL